MDRRDRYIAALERAAAVHKQEAQRRGLPGRPAVGYLHEAVLLRALAEALKAGSEVWVVEGAGQAVAVKVFAENAWDMKNLGGHDAVKPVLLIELPEVDTEIPEQPR